MFFWVVFMWYQHVQFHSSTFLHLNISLICNKLDILTESFSGNVDVIMILETFIKYSTMVIEAVRYFCKNVYSVQVNWNKWFQRLLYQSYNYQKRSIFQHLSILSKDLDTLMVSYGNVLLMGNFIVDKNDSSL